MEKRLTLQEQKTVGRYIEVFQGIRIHELGPRRRDDLPRGAFVVENQILTVAPSGVRGKGDNLYCSPRHAFVLGVMGVKFPRTQS